MGFNKRKTSSTLLNSNSSRSHTIFSILIESYENINNTEVIRKSKLNLIDLAGSEKIDKTGVKGLSLEESKNINLSLFNLGSVIIALTSNNKNSIIPYRNSILTSILKDSLGGNS